MADAMEIGIFPNEFWNLTLRELAACFKGAGRRLQRDYELNLWTAWHAALFERVKKFPSLSDVLQKIRKPTKSAQTPEEINRTMQALAREMASRSKSMRKQRS